MNKIEIITTTSLIDDCHIERYLGIVTDQVVAGTDIISDIFASFSDFFGGYSKTYQYELQKMEEIALNNLKEKASKIGANILLGVRIDFDEISGGGKSMLMLSVSGTAAYVNTDKIKITKEPKTIEYISKDELKFELERDRLKEKILSDSFEIRNKNQIEALIKYKIFAIEKIIMFMDRSSFLLDDDIIELITRFFADSPKTHINNFFRSDFFTAINDKTFKKFIKILEKIGWFDLETIEFLLKSDDPTINIRTLYLLELDKNIYAKKDIEKDIEKLENLIELINMRYKKFPIIQKRKGMLGKEKEEWVCFNCGSQNGIDIDICPKTGCNSNFYGIPDNKITPQNVSQTLSKKITKLEQIFNLN
jgi:uncharacterized protein YbjQ (UPF0145 family)